MPHLELKPDRIVNTSARLTRRISERFGETGLTEISREVHAVAMRAEDQAASLARPVLALRILVTLSIAALFTLMVLVFAAAVPSLDTVGDMDVTDRLSSLDAGIAQLASVGIAVFYLVTLERRIKRDRAIKAIQRLRVIAHVIDMHQLTKDPDPLYARVQSTDSSPERLLSPGELVRYLDYCSELLSLLGTIAALYIQAFDDPAALASASEFEGLTRGLSQKIWNKISIAGRASEAAARDVKA